MTSHFQVTKPRWDGGLGIFILFFHLRMLDAESEENCTFTGAIGLKGNSSVHLKIKFANCSVNAVSKEHGIPKQTLRDYLIFSSIKTCWRHCLQDDVFTCRVALLPTYPLALLPSRAFKNANRNDFTF